MGSAISSQRKDDHIHLAAQQQRTGHGPFDDVELVHHALAGIDARQVSLTTTVAGCTWSVPLYINGMTGGTETSARINRQLAIAARECGVPMASGSVGIAIDEPETAASFTVIREENPDGIVLANIGAGRPAEHAVRAVELLRADALQLHLNAVQETVMPEGSREFSGWLRGIEQTVAAVSVPVIVKEVGFGLSARTLQQLAEVGVTVADVAGTGGTNFARIESARGGGDFAYLASLGLSAVECILDSRRATHECQDAAGAEGTPRSIPELLASGGVRNPLDVVKALALGARAVGVAGGFLTLALEETPEALLAELRRWLRELPMLLALFGAPTPAALQHTDLLIRGRAREFAELRGIDLTELAYRADRPVRANSATNG